MTFTLRDYQKDGVDALYGYWDQSLGKNPIICVPTGGGKSIMIAEFCKRTCTEWHNVRIVCVTHTRELISQNEKELRSHWREASTGIYSAGLGKRQTQAQILFVGIQSIYNKAFKLEKTDIILIDEAHMIPREAQTRYGKFISDMKIANPNVVIVGFTATPYRLDTGVLHEGKDALFDGIAYCCEMKRLIKEGWLVPVISKGGVLKIDLTGVPIRAGEYGNSELAHAADDPDLVRRAVAEIVEYGKERKAWIVFCSGIVHAEHVAAEIRKHEIKCEVVTGKTPKAQRDETVAKFKNGKLRCLVNVAVFTTGFNAPCCDLIALLMATRSTGKYVQIVGRGMRTFPEKENCLLLDYGSNVLTHGMIDDIDPIKTKNVFNVEASAPPTKECPQCHAILYARTMQCPACGYEFPVSASHGCEAYDGAVMKSQQNAFEVDIVETWYSRHKKPGSPDSLKIGMFTKLDKEYPIWCCLDHTGFAQEKARALVKQFGGSAMTVTDALKESQFWRKPKSIKVVPSGKFFNVVGIEFHPLEAKQKGLDQFGEEEPTVMPIED